MGQTLCIPYPKWHTSKKKNCKWENSPICHWVKLLSLLRICFSSATVWDFIFKSKCFLSDSLASMMFYDILHATFPLGSLPSSKQCSSQSETCLSGETRPKQLFLWLRLTFNNAELAKQGFTWGHPVKQGGFFVTCDGVTWLNKPFMLPWLNQGFSVTCIGVF